MSAQIIAFPRRRPLEWEEMPQYWCHVARSYYEMDVEDGMSHQEAFAKWDDYARRAAAWRDLKRQSGESQLEFLARQARAALAAMAEA